MLHQEAHTPVGSPGVSYGLWLGDYKEQKALILPSYEETCITPNKQKKVVTVLLKLWVGMSFLRIKGKTPQNLVHFVEEQDWAGQSSNVRISHLPSG